jgi:CheY-like chemotaxis protein
MDSEARRHILVCDDDPVLRLLFEEILGEDSYRVTAQAGICEHLDEVIRLAPDLIVLDILFGGIPSGFDFLWRLKDNPATRSIPILTCTAAAIIDEGTCA